MDSITQFSDETVQSLIELGRQTAGPAAVQKIDGSPVPFIIHNGEVTQLPGLIFNEHAERPERINANVSLFDPQSFNTYYGLFSDENSRVFADETKQQVVAILDYHESGAAGEPRWGQHRATLSLRASEQWKTWTGKNNQSFGQQAFAEFLEQNAMDIKDPAPASIREITSDLQATTEVDFGSGLRMNDGQVRFKYTETTKTTVNGSEIKVPDHFTLEIPVFVGGPPCPMYAFLRWRIKEQKLIWWYTLRRPEESMRIMFLAARDSIASNLGITIINGVPA